jgi:hypothetical protein
MGAIRFLHYNMLFASALGLARESMCIHSSCSHQLLSKHDTPCLITGKPCNCSQESTVRLVFSLFPGSPNVLDIKTYPDGYKQQVVLDSDDVPSNLKIELINASGEIVHRTAIPTFPFLMKIPTLDPGFFLLRVKWGTQLVKIFRFECI